MVSWSSSLNVLKINFRRRYSNIFYQPFCNRFYLHILLYNVYYLLSERYYKNFTTPKTRARVSFTTEFLTNIIEAISLFLVEVLLDNVNINYSTLIIGLVFTMLLVWSLDYMRKRVGLKPEEYDQKDIELE